MGEVLPTIVGRDTGRRTALRSRHPGTPCAAVYRLADQGVKLVPDTQIVEELRGTMTILTTLRDAEESHVMGGQQAMDRLATLVSARCERKRWRVVSRHTTRQIHAIGAGHEPIHEFQKT